MTTSTSPRSAPGARTSWTRAGKSRAAWTPVPPGRLTFGEEAELKDLIAKAEVLNPETGAKPRIYYIGLPNKYFIAGAVFDPEADECLEGATVTLTNAASRASPPADHRQLRRLLAARPGAGRLHRCSSRRTAT